jgi:hypothetical protein
MRICKQGRINHFQESVRKEGLVHGYAIRQEESWNKSSSCWVISQSRRKSDTSAASSGFAMRSTITSVWSRIRPHDRRGTELFPLADSSVLMFDGSTSFV